MQAILQYWFAAQQQASTFRRQKFDLFYLKFSAEFNELSLSFYKMPKTKVVQKNAYMHVSESKGEETR